MENHPVIVREIKATRDPNTVSLQLEQENNSSIVNSSQALGFLMQGHEKFTPQKPKSSFTNVSAVLIRDHNIKAGQNLPESWNPSLVTLEFVEGEVIEEKYLAFFKRGTTVFSPRTWVNEDGTQGKQSPKTAGKNGEVLTFGGKVIYRDTYLSIFNMPKEDKLIAHDNVIVGSNVPATQTQLASVGQPQMP